MKFLELSFPFLFLFERIKKGFWFLQKNNKKKNQRVLILAPEAGLSAHYNTAITIGRILESKGAEVFYIRCFQDLPRCSFKGALQLPFNESVKNLKKVCTTCLCQSTKTLGIFSLQTIFYKNIFNKVAKKILRNAAQKISENIKNFKFLGLPIGAMCGYEVRIGLKKLILNSDDQETFVAWKSLILSAVKNCLFVLQAHKIYRFSHCISFNDYSYFFAPRLLLEKKQVKTFMVTHAYHMGVDRRKWVIQSKPGLQSIYTDCLQWEKWRQVPLSSEIISKIKEDIYFRLTGKSPHIYSSQRTGKSFEAFKKISRKKIVIYTSSPDESASLNVLTALGLEYPKPEFTFGTNPENCQIDWLNEVVEFIYKNSSIQCIIRVHPREGTNQREPRTSEHLSQLKKILKTLPENIVVIWPEDKISSYDLCDDADLVLTSWSTIGLEMARIGVPVLTCTLGLGGYPNEKFLEFVKSKKLYFDKIKEKLNSLGSYENIKLAFRWWHFAFLSKAINMEKIVHSHDSINLPKISNASCVQDVARTILEGIDQRSLVYKDLCKGNLKTKNLDEKLAIFECLQNVTNYLSTENNIKKLRPSKLTERLFNITNEASL